MNKLFFFTAIFFAVILPATAQQKVIKGNVLISNHAVEGIYIQIVNPASGNVIAYDATTANGNYGIAIDPTYSKVKVKISYTGYNEVDTMINVEQFLITLNFNLQKNFKTLEEINVVVARPIEVNGDTTNYNVASLKKDEKSIESLLKKLPGFEVDDKGKIKFKNKPIKTILLDGDDVVNNDYQVLSKNITPEMVDKIQAIENYNSNELLNGISKGEETVLNLQINRKFKGVVLLKSSAVSTIKDSLHLVENTALSIFKNLKIINVFNKNNIGEYNNNASVGDDMQDQIRVSSPLINNDHLLHLAEKNNTKFNNTLSNNFNFFYKQKGRFEINARYKYFSDNQLMQSYNKTVYLSNVPVTEIEERIKKQITGRTNDAYLFAKVYTSALSYLRIKASGQLVKSSLYNENKNTFNSLFNNNTDTLSTNNINLYFIKKLNVKNAFEAEINRNDHRNAQLLFLSPGLYTDFFNVTDYTSISQPSDFSEKKLTSELRITGYRDWIKYKFKAGYSRQHVQYFSTIQLLQNNTPVTADSLKNNESVREKTVYFSASLEKSFYQEKLNIKMENYFRSSSISTKVFRRGSQIFYNPDIQVIYKIAPAANFSFTFKKLQSFGDSKKYAGNYFFQDYKTLEKSNVMQALLEKRRSYTLAYTNVNLLKNQRSVFLSSNFNTNDIPFYRYFQNYDAYNIQNIQPSGAPLKNISWINYAIFSKRINPVQYTVKLSLFYIFNRSALLFNNSLNTDLTSNIIIANAGLNSGNKGRVGYDLKMGLTYNKNRTASRLFSNSFDNLSYNASALVAIRITKSISANIDYKYFKNRHSTNYLNADVGYEVPKVDLIVSIGGTNLFNNRRIVNFYATDFFVQQNEVLLFPRFVYLKIAYNFSFKL